MTIDRSLLAVPLWLIAGLATTQPAAPAKADMQSEVRETERAFAKTLADRNLAAFASFVAEEAVFLARETPLNGRAAVIEGWKGYFDGPAAPFSWEPDRVEVLASGSLAISTGPVRNPEGKRVGTFVSTWRREADGRWRIVLDTGCPRCECPPTP